MLFPPPLLFCLWQSSNPIMVTLDSGNIASNQPLLFHPPGSCIYSINVNATFPIKMTKHLVGGIILLDCTVIWLQMVDNTGVLLVARQLKETFTDVTPCFFLINATFKYKKNVRSSCELC